MGTDVYLDWDGKTEEERNEQTTPFSIDAGKVGYLRASIHMEAENTVLCILFPSEYWKCKKIEYDFVENSKRLQEIVVWYILGKNEQVCTINFDIVEKQKVMKDAVKRLIKEKGATNVTFAENEDIGTKKIWAHSLVDFFQLGVKKQREGKHPTVCISW